MKVNLESTRIVCDHCDELSEGIILSALFADHINGSIQLCKDHAVFFAKEILNMCEKRK